MAYIKRNIFNILKLHLKESEMTLIVGLRQVGKTTLMKSLKEIVEQEGKKTLFLNYDNETDRSFFSKQESLLAKIKLEFGESGGYVFIDEIQRKEDAGLFLKGLYDLGLPYKFVISGSGSLELKEKIHESLAGRKKIFEVQPISFDEFVDFKTGYKYSGHLIDFFRLEKIKVEQFLFEYLNFGGYPRVIIEPTEAGKRSLIDEIYKSYLERDINYLLKLDKSEAFVRMIKLLADQIGKLVNYSELAVGSSVSVATIRKYLWYAEKTMAIRLISPFFKNQRNELVKSPVVYFSDLGLRNYSLDLFGHIKERISSGFVFQNFIANILQSRLFGSNAVLHFWRTTGGAEVDFVIERGVAILPIEVKFKSLEKVQIEKSLRSFIEKYHPKEAWVVNLDFNGELMIGATKVRCIPFYELFKENL